MPVSVVNLLCLSDPLALHATVRSLPKPMITKPVISPKGLEN